MTPKTFAAALAGLAATALAGSAAAASLVVPMALATPQGPGASVGQVTLSDSPKGVSIALDLKGLPPGQHGFHLHGNPSCAPAAAADGTVTPAGGAGAHLDPGETKTHMGPEGAGHLGDLPRIEVAADGTARQTLAAPRFKSVAELQGHALMIHAGGDTYADTPPLGGGGARLACGVVR
ncbi:superoxide dismutase family protein [Phenylobacterium soli]|uniref:Superoxide dismutase [Cu-Zn] n=1 Tax=Phenylobacterium soli TaxID=2170551 RepID=A0A328AFQ4_9CAUL|nr:superoxide dismutase family protein [Phenylobacterium soli]RAK53357.1 superoxide dismutase [Cu-Zn] SodC1 [Phenylobacterium soli]